MRAGAAIVCVLMLAAFSCAAKADPYMDEALRLYFKHHPVREKEPRVDFYPNPGPVIAAGGDVPICAAARTAAAYTGEEKTGLRYLLHGRDGWIFATPNFRTDFTALPQTMDDFTRLNQALKTRGQTLVILFSPPRAMLETRHFDPADVPAGYTPDRARKGYLAFLDQLKGAGITAVGVTEAPPKGDYFRARDIHWTHAGATFSAGIIADAVRATAAYGGMKKQDFETAPAGFSLPAHGMYDDAMQRICGLNLEIQSYKQWTTSAVAPDAAVSEGSLLGDEDFPAITVLGTSFSASDETYGFVGTLKRLLHTDIYNAAIVGGSFASSAYRYFASDEYHAHPPKVVLWEFAALHNYNKKQSLKGFRQMIPAVYGACEEKDAVATYAGDITDAKTEFLQKAEGRALKNTYLYMQVTHPAERALRLQVLYADGVADDVELTRDTRMGNNGKYYFELGPAPPVFFRMTTDRPEGRLSARICRYPGGR